MTLLPSRMWIIPSLLRRNGFCLCILGLFPFHFQLCKGLHHYPEVCRSGAGSVLEWFGLPWSQGWDSPAPHSHCDMRHRPQRLSQLANKALQTEGDAREPGTLRAVLQQSSAKFCSGTWSAEVRGQPAVINKTPSAPGMWPFQWKALVAGKSLW